MLQTNKSFSFEFSILYQDFFQQKTKPGYFVCTKKIRHKLLPKVA